MKLWGGRKRRWQANVCKYGKGSWVNKVIQIGGGSGGKQTSANSGRGRANEGEEGERTYANQRAGEWVEGDLFVCLRNSFNVA